MLYQAMVIRESGKLEEGLEHLNKYEGLICDKLTVQEMRGEPQFLLNRLKDKERKVGRVHSTDKWKRHKVQKKLCGVVSE